MAWKAALRWIRVQRPVTAMLGPQYIRSTDRIEIDITYRCNLKCLNCNRSCRQAPADVDLPLERVHEFVEASLARSRRWRSIRVLGGEPTLHPRFEEIVALLGRYTEMHPECSLEVVSNGHGEVVRARLRSLPPDVWVEDSAKRSEVQEAFRPFNLAPLDDWRFAYADFRNACPIVHDCGMGLAPGGYYPCAIAAGIDRVLGWDLGRDSLPADDDQMLEVVARCCPMCGRFRDGTHVPTALREPLRHEAISASWKRAYRAWRKRRGL